MSGNEGSFAGLLKAVWCPVCAGKLTVEVVEGKQVLKCAVHGEMKAYLEHDPLVSAAFVGHCGAVGVVNIEGA